MEEVMVEIDYGTCVGNVECLRRLPEAFLLDDHEGQAVAINPQPGSRRGALEEVAEACPTKSISLTFRTIEM